MTEPSQEIAIRQDSSPALINPTTDSWTAVVRDVAKLSDHIAGTEFVPKDLRDSSAKIAAAILHGRELGLPPMTALAATHIVHGRPGISAEAMRALVFQAGHQIVVTETTGAKCVIKGKRADMADWSTVEWTMAMAQAAGLPAKNPQTWKSYPRQMLQARATTELCRLLFPDVIHGLHSIEELEDLTDDELAAVPATPEQPQEARTGVQRSRRSSRARQAVERPAEPQQPPSQREAVDLPERGKPEPEATPEQQAETDAERERQQAELAKLAEQHRQDVANGDGHKLSSDGQEPSTPEPAKEEAEPVDAEIVEDAPQRISDSQMWAIRSHCNRLGVTGRDQRLIITAFFAGREQIESTKDLTLPEAVKAIQRLEKLRDPDALEQALSTDSLLGD